MIIIENIINPSKYQIIKQLNGICLTFKIEAQTDLDIIFMKQAYNSRDIVCLENVEYLIESYSIEGYIVKFTLVNYPIK